MLIDSVNIKGLLAPNVTIDTVKASRAYNVKLSSIRKGWGGICIASDGLIMLTCKFHALQSLAIEIS
jgi:hypothetical protein